MTFCGGATAAEGLDTGGSGVEIYGWLESLVLRDFLRAFIGMGRREGEMGRKKSWWRLGGKKQTSRKWRMGGEGGKGAISYILGQPVWRI